MLVGDASVGKTALLNRYVNDKDPAHDSTSTIGVEFSKRTLNVNGKQIQVHIWDTAGQERFKSLTTHHYRGAHAALLVYDVTQPSTYEKMQTWLDELHEHTLPSCVIKVVANKCDLVLGRKVPVKPGTWETSSYWSRDSDKGIGRCLDAMVESVV